MTPDAQSEAAARALVPKGGIPALDGIRAIAVMIVFLSHLEISGMPGDLGVTIFFFLSGFLITRLLLAERLRFGRVAIGAFYLRRLLRLYPALVATLVAAYALMIAGIALGYADPAGLLSQLFYVHNYYIIATEQRPAVPFGSTLLWSLAVEEHFYLVWPLLLAAIAVPSRLLRITVGLLVLMLAWRAFRWGILDTPLWVIAIATDTRIDSILFGCLLALMDGRGLTARVFPEGAGRYWVPAGLVVLVLSVPLAAVTPFAATGYYTLQGLALMPLFRYAVANPGAMMVRPLGWPPVVRIGQLSYTFYLSHHVIIISLQYQFGLNLAQLYWIGPLAFALSLGWAWLLDRTIEDRPRRMRHQLRQGEPT